MRVVVQRVSSARVEVDGDVVGAVGTGLLVLVGIADGDEDATIDAMADKVAKLRVMADDDGRMNRSVVDVGGAVLVVSQFTLLADTRRGNRPSYMGAAAPEVASVQCDRFADRLRDAHGLDVATGTFGAMMDVHLVNDGPVTIVLDA